MTEAEVCAPPVWQSKVYGASDPTLTFANDGGLAPGSFTGALTRAAGENVGTYAITLGTLSAGTNYSLSLAATPVNFTITPATLTIHVSAASPTTYTGLAYAGATTCSADGVNSGQPTATLSYQE